MTTEPVLAIPEQYSPDLPNVLLIGDSISFGYSVEVQKQLEKKANIYRIQGTVAATVTGALRLDTRNAVAHLNSWLGNYEWAVIHFNWGLHDVKLDKEGRHQVPLDEYERNLRTLVERLLRTRVRLIWASTIPIPSGDLSPKRRSGDEELYNAVASRIMTESGIPINDLHAFALPQLSEIQQPQNVHFTEIGSARLAVAVATSIERVLGR